MDLSGLKSVTNILETLIYIYIYINRNFSSSRKPLNFDSVQKCLGITLLDAVKSSSMVQFK